MNWKSLTFLGLIRELSLQGKLKSGEMWIHQAWDLLMWLRNQAGRTHKRQQQCSCRLLAGRRDSWGWQPQRAAASRAQLQEPRAVLRFSRGGESRPGGSGGGGGGRGRASLWNMLKVSSTTKFCSPGKGLHQSLIPLGKVRFFNSRPLYPSFPI